MIKHPAPAALQHSKPAAPAELDVRNLTVSYNSHPALDDVSFRVPVGSRVAVVGPNGAGKSTLFKALVGLLPIRSGQVLIHGLSWGQHIECVAYVPQREEVDWRFPVTVTDVVMMGRYGNLGWLQRPGKQDRAIVTRSLAQMGIADLASAAIGDLSGGQQQRVFLARALAQEPHILLMDEPFSGVDASTQEATLNLLDELKAEGVTALVSTHDLNLAAARFDRVLLLNQRVIAYGAPADVLKTENVLHAYGSQVLSIEGNLVIDECCPPDEHTLAASSPILNLIEK